MTKRDDILVAATKVFAENGFVGASMDQVVAEAAVSKQTVYKHFKDKAQLFREIVVDIGDRVDELFLELPGADTIDDVSEWIHSLALRFTEAVMAPEVQRIRRLVIAEAPRFPDVAQTYWEGGFLRVIGTVAEHLAQLGGQGKLSVPDPLLAAQHFAGLLLWIPSNKAMFAGGPDAVSAEELTTYAHAGATAFLAAYGQSTLAQKS